MNSQDIKHKALQYKKSYWSYSIIAKSLITGVNVNNLFELRLTSEEKTRLPFINLLSNPYYSFACLDFDNLKAIQDKWPGFDTWEEVERLIFPNLLPSGYLCLKTPSGKRKILYLVAGIKTDKDVLAWFKQMGVSEDIMSLVDTCYSALTKMFINNSMYTNLISYLENDPKIYHYSNLSIVSSLIQESMLEETYNKHIFYTYNQAEEVSEKSESKEWIDYTGEINLGIKSHTAICLLRFMLGNPFLAMKKIGLNQLWLAERYGVTQAAISKAIHHLIKKGYLNLLIKGFYGSHCARYSLSGNALILAKEIYFTRCGKQYSEYLVNCEMLSNPILDGEWNRRLLIGSRFFQNPESYLLWFESKEGHTEGSRRKQAISIWNSYASKKGYRLKEAL